MYSQGQRLWSRHLRLPLTTLQRNLHSRVHLHSEVGDESCSWNLHLKRDFLVLRPSVEHPTGNCGEGITGDDGRFHRELRHQGFGFLLESKHTVCCALETITTLYNQLYFNF